MPVIHTHVSVTTTPEQREALKNAYGAAISILPGKSEGWLMCPFEDGMPIYFAGDDKEPEHTWKSMLSGGPLSALIHGKGSARL